MHTIDTHSHLNLHQFAHDREDAILRMQAAGVGTICVGIDIETSEHAVMLAATHDCIWACIGQHPTEWEKGFDRDAFIALAQAPRVVAIGECGLDYFREEDRLRSAIQREVFVAQIELARAHDLPLMLHIRPKQGTMDAYEDALEILKEYRDTWSSMRGTAHFFVGSKEIAAQFVDLGFYISFSGVVTIFPEYESLVQSVPIDRILPETDAPFAAPLPYRGKRNEPAYVVEVVKKIAEIKKLPLEETQEQLLKNSKHLFKI